MRWPWSKKPEPIPPPKPVEYPDDWEHKVGNWGKVESCHCGAYRKHWNTTVCGVCGCDGRWTTRVEREEWEESPSRLKAWQRIWFGGVPQGLNSFYAHSVKRVVWTPEHCQTEHL